MKNNKKHLVAAAALASAGFFAAQASASLLIYEPFSSAPGTPITGTSPQTPASETWLQAGTVGSTVHQIGSPGLVSPAGFPAATGNMADLTNADNKEMERLSIPDAFNTDLSPKYAAGSSLFYSLLLNVPSTAGLTVASSNLNANNDILIGFNNIQGSSAGRPSSWNGELVIRQGSDASHFNLGIRGSTTTANTTYFTGDLNPGQTYLIVAQAQINATDSDGTNSLWVNPNPATFGAAVAPTADGSSNGLGNSGGSWSMQSILIGAGIAAGAAPTDSYMDEIRVGDTWADVTSVPEPATLGLLGLGALGLVSRRRRTA